MNLSDLFTGMTWWKIEKESKYNRRMAKKDRKQRKAESKAAGKAWMEMERQRLAMWEAYYRNGGR